MKFTEKESIQKNEEIIDSDDNTMDSPERDEPFNVPRKKTKGYMEADVQKCVEEVQSEAMSQSKVAILHNVPRKAIHNTLKGEYEFEISIPVTNKNGCMHYFFLN